MRCWRGHLLERSASSLHMVRLMPLLPHHLRLSEIQNSLSFWYQPTQVVLEKKAVKRLCVCYTMQNANAKEHNPKKIWKFKKPNPHLLIHEVQQSSTSNDNQQTT